MTAGDQGIATRGSTTTQALVSAALVLPTVVIWYLRALASDLDWSVDILKLWSLAWTAVLGGYFVAVVAVFARTAARRLPAVIMGIAATVLDVGGSAVTSFASYTGAVEWVDRILTAVTLVGFVAAWGIARRQTPKWAIGLAPTLVVAVLITVLYSSGLLYRAVGTAWIAYWAVWIGAFLLGCLICWGFDAMGSSSASGAAAGARVPVQNLGPPAYPLVQQTNSMAIAALVSSLVLAPLGIVFGHLALSQIKRSGDDGRGLAIAGLVIGYAGTVLLVLSVILVVVYFAVMIGSLDDVS